MTTLMVRVTIIRLLARTQSNKGCKPFVETPRASWSCRQYHELPFPDKPFDPMVELGQA